MVALTLKPKIEKDFEPGDSANLPRVDCFTVAIYLSNSNKKFDTNARSPNNRYGDDSIGYVQLCRNEGLCTLKARVSPQPTVYADVTLIMNEIKEEVVHIECHSCEAPQTGCIHGPAFLIWLHRRSEEPALPHRKSYWKKPKIAQVVSKQKFITVKQLSKAKRQVPQIQINPAVLTEFLSEAKKQNLDGPLIRYLTAKEADDES